MKTNETIRDHATFRTVLQAMSRPGTIQSLLDNNGADPLVILLTSLLDNEVGVAVIGDNGTELLDRLVRATGCRQVVAEEADFVLVHGGSSCGSLAGLRRGTSDYPENGATVLYLLDEVAADGGKVTLNGPGIKDRVTPLLCGLGEGELQMLGEVNRDFPLGVDAIFLDRCGRLTCIPRSTRIGEE